eukprot:TRINITY_DN18872_c0_g1_i1.p1 TRINITY_DN18872_c0_g1~~TRINITY_DN18872_c0_g1_i1.p1  ORF type:complete len:448 (+),score=74.97 TRINITY_DN18872_c0_g1_i1:36-1379(+)
MATIAPAPPPQPASTALQSERSGHLTLEFSDDPGERINLVPGLCQGAAGFNGVALSCCMLFIVTPVVLLICYVVYSYTAMLAVAIILFVAGALWFCHALSPVCAGAVISGVPPDKHSPFKRVWEGDRQGQKITVKKVYMIVNPHGGGGKAKGLLEAEVLPVLKEAGVEVDVKETTHSGHPVEYAQTLPLEGYDAMCVMGGDGSIHEMVNGMLKRVDGKQIPMGFIPAGTGNSVMCDLGTWSATVAAERIANGAVAWMDVLRVTDGKLLDSYSLNGVFWGLVGDVGIASERGWMRTLFGALRYDLMAVWGVMKEQTYTAKVTADNYVIPVTSFTTLFVNNTQYFGKGLRATPDAYLDDSLADLCFLPATSLSRGDKLRVFNELPLGTHRTNAAIHMSQAAHIRLETGKPNTPNICSIDGEMITFSEYLDIVCLHKHIQIFAPASPTPK